jgi:M6 family metalloprotease-like protein
MSHRGLGAILILVLCPLVWSQAPGTSVADRIGALNDQVSANPRGANARAALDERAALLHQLIATDPARAIQLGLPSGLAQQLRTLHPPELLEEQGEWTGTLERLTEDDFEHGQSRRHILLHTADQQLEIFLTEEHPLPRGQSIRVSGMRVSDRIAVTSLGTVEALGTAPAAEATVQAATTDVAAALTSSDCNTVGDQKTAVIMVTTPASPLFPVGFDSTFFNQRYFVGSNASLASSSVNLFMQEVSNSQTSLTGIVVGPYALSQNYTCSQYSSLLTAALAAADPSVDFTIYRRIVVLFPISSCSYAGLGTIGCSPRSTSDGSNQASVSWIPILPGQSTQTIVPIISHEFGHNLGLGHAHTEDFGNVTLGRLGVTGTSVEYGDPFSTMGLSRSFNGQPIAGQYPSPQKTMMLGWIGSTGYQEIQSGGTMTVAPLENASGVRALRILRDPATSSWLWLEYRQPIGIVDSSLSLLQNSGPSTVFQGALLHYEAPVYGDDTTTNLLDTTPVAVPNQFLDAALLPGRTWSDTDSLLNITVNSATSSEVSVTVTYDAACATLQASATEFASSGGNGTITVTAPTNCNWSASSAFGWLRLTGATSGQGNGTVPFSVSANGSSSQRQGYITVQRQSIPFMQAGLGLSALSVSPSRGSGLSGQFVFRLRDSSGYGAINGADLYFENVYIPNLPSCIVRYTGSTTSLRLWTDNGNALSSALSLANAGSSISNSQCTLFATGSSIVGSGTDLTITVQMSFAPTFSGTHRIGASATDSSSSSGEIALGMWTVGSSSCSYSLGSQGQNFDAAGGTGIAGITTGSACSWTASSDTGWLTITGGSSGVGNGSVAFSVAALTTTTARTGHLTIGGQTFTVQQTGCTYSLGSSSQQFDATGGNGSISVIAPASCPWTASGGATWITVSGATSGTGNGGFNYSVAANLGGSRSATFNIGNSIFTINQTGITITGTPVGSLAQIASAGGWTMVLNYLNLGTATAQAQMDFSGDDGSPLILPFTFPQDSAPTTITTSSLSNTINPGAQRIAQTTGPVDQVGLVGSGRLSGPAGVTAFGIFINTVRSWQAAVPLITKNASRYMLAFDNTGKLVTGIAIANLAPTAANIPVVIRDPQGNAIFSGNLALAALGHSSFMLNTNYPVTTGLRGTIEFQTPVGGSISALGLRANGPSLTTLPVLADVGTGGGSLTHVVFNGGFTNSFTLVNTSSSTATFTLNFFDGAGNPTLVPLSISQTGETVTTSSLTRSIPANGSLLIETIGQADISPVEGSAQLISSSNVGGFAIFNRLSSGQEASVPLEDRTVASYVLPFDNTTGLFTGIALAETAHQTSTIPVTIRNDNGALLLSTSLTLPANGHLAFMLPDQFPVATGIRGTIEFVTPSGGRFSAIGLRATSDGNLTTIPVIAK